MGQARYTARVERLPDGSYRASVDAFGGFEVRATTLDELKKLTPGALDSHISELQSYHEPVISSDGVDFAGPDSGDSFVSNPLVEALRQRALSHRGQAPTRQIALGGSGYFAFLAAKALLSGFALRSVSGPRVEGAVSGEGLGYLVDEVPFGGSTIEGCHRTFTVVLEDALLIAEDDGATPNAPTTLRIWGSPGRAAELETQVQTSVP